MYWKILKWGATAFIALTMAAAFFFAPTDEQAAPKAPQQQQGKKFNF